MTKKRILKFLPVPVLIMPIALTGSCNQKTQYEKLLDKYEKRYLNKSLVFDDFELPKIDWEKDVFYIDKYLPKYYYEPEFRNVISYLITARLNPNYEFFVFNLNFYNKFEEFKREFLLKLKAFKEVIKKDKRFRNPYGEFDQKKYDKFVKYPPMKKTKLDWLNILHNNKKLIWAPEGDSTIAAQDEQFGLFLKNLFFVQNMELNIRYYNFLPMSVNNWVTIDNKKRIFENYRRYYSKINMEVAFPNSAAKQYNVTFSKLLLYLGIVDKPKTDFLLNNDDREKYGDIRVDVTFNNMHFKVNDNEINDGYSYFTFNDMASRPISKQFISSKEVTNNYYVEAYNKYDSIGFPGSGIKFAKFLSFPDDLDWKETS